jgi:hypothetical protein
MNGEAHFFFTAMQAKSSRNCVKRIKTMSSSIRVIAAEKTISGYLLTMQFDGSPRTVMLSSSCETREAAIADVREQLHQLGVGTRPDFATGLPADADPSRV